MSKNVYNEACPVCGDDSLQIILDQGDHMRVTGGPTVRMGVQARIICVSCGRDERSAWVDVTLEFGEAIR